MATLAELNDRLIEHADGQAKIIALSDQEKRDLTKEEQESLDTLQADYESTERQIDLRSRAEEHNDKLSGPRGPASIGIEPFGPDDNVPEGYDNQAPLRAKGGSLARSPRTPVLEHARAVDKGRRGFQTLGDFASSVAAYARPGGQQDMRLRHMLAPTTWGSGGIGADGGFAVPPDFRSEIQEKVMAEDTLFGLTDRLITSSNSITVPVDETTPWQSSGGVLSYWTGEGSAMTQSKPSLQQRTVQLHKLTVLIPVTEELVGDAPALNTYLNRKAPQKITFEIDRTIIRGSGAGQPLGILNSPALISTTRTADGNATDLADIVALYSRVYAPYRGKPSTVWLMNQDVEPSILQLNSSTSNNVYFGQPNAGVPAAPGQTLLGHRIIYTQACSASATVGDVIFAALGEYMTATKAEGVRTDVSMHLFFDYDMMAFRFIVRIAGMPWLSTTISPLNGSTSYSAFATIAT